MDLSTGFPFALPMRGCTAKETAQNLLSIFCGIGVPKAILSDQGRKFKFKCIISGICDFSSLIIPVLSDSFCIFTDASMFGVGGVLWHRLH